MLHHRHQLNMRISHLLHIFDDLRRQFSIIIVFSSILRLSKGRQINLIDIDRPIFFLTICTAFHPLIVFPLKTIQFSDHGSAFRAELLSKRIGIRFQKSQTAFGLNLKLIAVAWLHIRNKDLKDPGLPKSSHLMDSAIPSIEISYHTDAQCIRRPHGKQDAFYAFHFPWMRSQLLIRHIMNPCIELLRIFSGNLHWKTVGILYLLKRTVLIFYNILVLRYLLSRKQRREKTFFVSQFHLIALIPLYRLQAHTLRARLKRLDQHRTACSMSTQRRMRIIGL